MSTAAKTVSCYENVDEETFSSLIFPKREPAVLRGVPVGPCTSLWDKEYLCMHGGNRDVKNIAILSTCGASVQVKKYQLLHKRDRVLLLQDTWDVLRIASPQLSLWTHYDVMDNFLIQVKGKKKAVLFHPNDFEYLYIQGDKSLVLDLECPDLAKFPKFRKATRYEATLTSGDILFIPALWFHNITALDFGIAVNVFWKNLDASLYDKKDPYGNKDLIPASSALTLVEKAVKQLQLLPLDCQPFYALKMISHIKNHFGLS
ncbi:hypothetical protein MRX96_032705 [Rhipicephalus microplus]